MQSMMTRTTTLLGLLSACMATGADAATTCNNGNRFSNIGIAGNSLRLQENFYNPNGGEMCVDYNYGSSFAGAFTVINTNTVATNGAPGGYPSLYKGCHWGTCSANSGMPVKVRNIGSMRSSWSIARNGAGGNWNAAYDIWFDKGRTPNAQPNGTELMIWVNWNGRIQPIGTRIAQPTIGGRKYDMWVGENSGGGKTWNVISFVVLPGQPFSPNNLNLKNFVDRAASTRARRNDGSLKSGNVLSREWFLIDIEAGFEVWSGGSGLRTDYFDATVR